MKALPGDNPLLFGNFEHDDDPRAELIRLEKSGVRKMLVEQKRNPARFGGDFIPTFTFEGFRLVKIKVFRRQGLDVTREEIRRTLAEERIPYSHALIDENGVAARSWTI